MGNHESLHMESIKEMSTPDLLSYYTHLAPRGRRTYDAMKIENPFIDDIILIKQCVAELRERGIRSKNAHKLTIQ